MQQHNLDNGMLLLELRSDSQLDKNTIDDSIALSVMPLAEYYLHEDYFQHRMFVDCLSSYEANLGTLFIVRDGDKSVAFAFVYDIAPTINGTYHIHLFSVFKSYQKKGIGSKLMNFLHGHLGDNPITLESSPSTVGFFEKNGFVVTGKELDFDFKHLRNNFASNHDLFMHVQQTEEIASEFVPRFISAVNRLGIG